MFHNFWLSPAYSSLTRSRTTPTLVRSFAAISYPLLEITHGIGLGKLRDRLLSDAQQPPLCAPQYLRLPEGNYDINFCEAL
jgi:hypothetical protein